MVGKPIYQKGKKWIAWGVGWKINCQKNLVKTNMQKVEVGWKIMGCQTGPKRYLMEPDNEQ